MSEIAIRVDNLSKRYRLGQRQRYKTVRDAIQGIFRAPFSRRSSDPAATFWALKDVNFELKQGEVLGVIGRNGAGKSTLLKVLSRITEPTQGQVETHGRVGSLLEVGTGFHPELTGRENVFLNGAILGMKRTEIAAKFDEIVAFAEVEKFLDTPVKYYSSGMYTRLAFAVAANLDPEILIVDEVLAVGDALFQKKCMGKMSDVAKGGRTVLFVSHNMRAIEQLCTSVLALESGKVRTITKDVHGAITQYMHQSDDPAQQHSSWVNEKNLLGNEFFRPRRFFLSDAAGNPVGTTHRADAELYFRVEFDIENYDRGITIGYALMNEDGQHVYWSYHTDMAEEQWPALRQGYNVLQTRLPPRLLSQGSYRLELAAGLHSRAWVFEPGLNSPSILWTILGGVTDSPQWMEGRRGVLTPIIRWQAVGDKGAP
jgi:lipopolysaccharide transport system ATP-binding protein